MWRLVFVTVYTQDGWTPLMTAAWKGRYEVVVELLDDGADINAQEDVSRYKTWRYMYITYALDLLALTSLVPSSIIY